MGLWYLLSSSKRPGATFITFARSLRHVLSIFHIVGMFDDLNMIIWGLGLYGCIEGLQKNDETSWPRSWFFAMAKGWFDATLIKGEFLECAFLNYGSYCSNSKSAYVNMIERNLHSYIYIPQSKPVCSDLRQGLKTLKDSQVYPTQYGKEIARLHLTHVAACRHLYSVCH